MSHGAELQKLSWTYNTSFGTERDKNIPVESRLENLEEAKNESNIMTV